MDIANKIIQMWKHRIIFIFIGVVSTLLVVITNANYIILAILDTLKASNIELDEALLNELIWISFDIFDSNIYIDDIIISCNENYNYVPTFEINIRVERNNQVMFILITNILCTVIYNVSIYHICIIYSRSVYRHEKWDVISQLCKSVAIMPMAIIINHYIWAYMMLKIWYNNFAELNYVEFDNALDIQSYIYRYIISLNIHCWLLLINNKKHLYIFIAIVYISTNTTVFELIYYYMISITNMTLHNIIRCIMKRIYNLNEQEH